MRSNAASLAQLNQQRARRFVRETTAAAFVFENKVHATAQRFSSGTASTRALSAPPPGLNHPYGHGLANRRGRRGAVPNGGDLGIINQQTGTFKASWDALSEVRGDTVTVIAFNDAPYADALHTGTHLMKSRPIAAKIYAASRGEFLAMMAAARRRALR